MDLVPDLSATQSASTEGFSDQLVASIQESRRKISKGRRKAVPVKQKRKCPHCCFSSFYATSLKVHMRRHTGEKPYQCPYCPGGTMFSDRSNMNGHIRRVHWQLVPFRKDVRTAKFAPRMNSTKASLIVDRMNESPLTSDPIITSVYGGGQLTAPPELVPASMQEEYEEQNGKINEDSVDHEASSRIHPEIKTQRLNVVKSSRSRRKPSFVQRFDNGGPSLESLESVAERLTNSIQSFESPESEDFPLESQPVPCSVDLKHTSFNEGENLHAAQSNLISSPMQDHAGNYSETSQSSDNIVRQDGVSSADDAGSNDLYKCGHCDIYFRSCVLHTLHMGCHGYDEPFRCNICGVVCKDAVEFSCHFVRGRHSGVL